MKFDAHKLGFAGAIASAIFWTVCSISMAMWPMKSVALMADMFHLTSFGPLTELFVVGAASYVSGLIQYAVYSYVWLYIFAYAYNRIDNK